MVQYEVKPAPMPPGTYRNITGNLALSYGLIAGARAVRAADLARLLPDHPGLRHPPRAQQAQGVRRHHVPGRGRDRRHRLPRSAPRSPARLGVTTTSGPGIALKSEAIGLAVMTELPAGRDRRPARRPVDRPADQDRAGRPAAGDVRPQRRGAGADRRAAVARRLLRRRARGDPDRGHLPHPGDAALRRLPRQRLRAVADPRGRRPAEHRPELRHRAQPRARRGRRGRARTSGPTCATRRPWPGRGRSPAPPASSTASAASRRPRATATSPTTRPTTT